MSRYYCMNLKTDATLAVWEEGKPGDPSFLQDVYGRRQNALG